MTTLSNTPDEIRVDIWLWRARFFKTRTLAGKQVAAGKVRLSRGSAPIRLDKPSARVRIADVLTFSIGSRVYVVEIIELGVRRGPAAEAQGLYKNLAPLKPERISANAETTKSAH